MKQQQIVFNIYFASLNRFKELYKINRNRVQIYNRMQRQSRMSQIETYTTVLIENNHAYEKELQQVRSANSCLRHELQSATHSALVAKQRFEEELIALRSLYDEQTLALIQQLKQILQEREQAQRAHRTVIEELGACTESEARNRKAFIDDINKNYSRQIKQLSTKLEDRIKENQLQYSNHTAQKNKMMQDIDTLQYCIKEEKRHSGGIEKQNQLIRQQLLAEKRRCDDLTEQLEKYTNRCLILEQEKNTLTIEFKRNNTKLRDQLNKNIDSLKKSQAAANLHQQQALALAERLQKAFIEKQSLREQYQIIYEELKNKTEKLQRCEHQLSKVNELFSREQRRLSQLVHLLQIDNNKLRKEQQLIISDNHIKMTEMQSMHEKMKHLEVEKTHFAKTVLQLQEDLNESKKKEMSLCEVVDDLQLQVKSTNQKLTLQIQHAQTLQMQLNKHQRKNQFSNHGQEGIKNINPINEQKIYLYYQSALREKQNLFQLQINSLQKQVKDLRQII